MIDNKSSKSIYEVKDQKIYINGLALLRPFPVGREFVWNKLLFFHEIKENGNMVAIDENGQEVWRSFDLTGTVFPNYRNIYNVFLFKDLLILVEDVDRGTYANVVAIDHNQKEIWRVETPPLTQQDFNSFLSVRSVEGKLVGYHQSGHDFWIDETNGHLTVMPGRPW